MTSRLAAAARRGAAATLVAACVAATTPAALAADSAEALFKQALAINQDALEVEGPEARVLMLRDVDALLDLIVTRHPDSRLARMLAEGKAIGPFSRADVQARLADAEAALSPAMREALGAVAAGPAAQPAPTPEAGAGNWPQPLQAALLQALGADHAMDRPITELLRIFSGDTPVHVGAPPQVERGTGGRVTVTLDAVILGAGTDGAAEVDFIRIALTPEGDRHLAAVVTMAPGVRFDGGMIVMDAPRVEGLFNTDLKVYSRYVAEAKNLRAFETVTDAGGAAHPVEVMRLDSVEVTQDLDDSQPTVSGTGGFIVQGLVAVPEGPIDGAAERFALDRAALTMNLDGLDWNSYMVLSDMAAMTGLTGEEPSDDAVAALFAAMDWASAGVDLSLEGAAVSSHGTLIARGDALSLTLSADNDGGTGDMLLSLTGRGIGPTEAGWLMARAEEDSLSALPVGAVPTDAHLTLRLRSVPYGGLLQAAQQETAGTRRRAAEQAVAEAAPEVVLEALRLDAPEARLTGSGTVTDISLAGLPPTASGTFELAGLDMLIRHFKELAPARPDLEELLPVLVVLKGLGRAPGTPGTDTLVYDLSFSPQTGPTVNDVPLGALGAGNR
ncbi:hypothetical protein [Caenispirillum salinarum]|uniref:hypothetical protein n=1 Tax=Caenispirillum salinarum TaxID=859058 RepID=UPI00384AC4BF